MKKLLLLLLLAPIIIQAEVFNLVCKGIGYAEDSLIPLGKPYKETITVKVSEKTMKVGKIEYYTHKWKNDRVEAQGTYHKDKDSISGWNHSLVNMGGDGFCLTQQRTVLIDRISGTINLKQIDLGECKGRKSSFLYEFDGKCKKQDRTF